MLEGEAGFGLQVAVGNATLRVPAHWTVTSRTAGTPSAAATAPTPTARSTGSGSSDTPRPPGSPSTTSARSWPSATTGNHPAITSPNSSAKGIIAERMGIPMDAAFELLRGFARNHKLHDAARDVVTGTLAVDDLTPS